MKTVLMNVMKNSKMLVIAAIMTVAAHAKADDQVGKCYVRTSAICHADPRIIPGKDFADGVATGSHIDAGRCLQRAQEYKSWCGVNRAGVTPEVVTYFVVNNVIVIGVTTAADGHSYIFNGSLSKFSYNGFAK